MINSILNFFSSFWSEILSMVNLVINGILTAVGFLLSVTIEGLLMVVAVIISALDVGNLATAAAGAWGIIPSNVVYLLVQAGIPTGLTFIGYAWGIRFLINLIPAALTRI